MTATFSAGYRDAVEGRRDTTERSEVYWLGYRQGRRADFLARKETA